MRWVICDINQCFHATGLENQVILDIKVGQLLLEAKVFDPWTAMPFDDAHKSDQMTRSRTVVLGLQRLRIFYQR